MSPSFAEQVAALAKDWAENSRWEGVQRDYRAEHVVRLRGSVMPECTLAREGAAKLWERIHSMTYVHALGAMTGGQAIQYAKAGLPAIYLSGWQVAGDANLSGQVYPDQSLYPANSVPAVVTRLNNALRRADQIEWSESRGSPSHDYMLPIVADAEAGFGGRRHDRGRPHRRPRCEPHHERYRRARPRVPHRRGTNEGFFYTEPGLATPVKRALAYAPHCDLIWCETSTPDLDEARTFAEAIHTQFPAKKLAYNCSPSFNWKAALDDSTIEVFQKELGAMGYAFQFITLAGWHALNASAFDLARGYQEHDMTAYVELQQREFDMEDDGYTATRHQREVGAGYFDDVATVISGGNASTLALKGSTEEQQF